MNTFSYRKAFADVFFPLCQSEEWSFCFQELFWPFFGCVGWPGFVVWVFGGFLCVYDFWFCVFLFVCLFLGFVGFFLVVVLLEFFSLGLFTFGLTTACLSYKPIFQKGKIPGQDLCIFSLALCEQVSV